MENREVVYIKLSDDVIINENCIRWVKKMNECLKICTKSNGCTMDYHTNIICKKDNLNSYNKLNKHFGDFPS